MMSKFSWVKSSHFYSNPHNKEIWRFSRQISNGKAACFESNFYVSCASYIATLEFLAAIFYWTFANVTSLSYNVEFMQIYALTLPDYGLSNKVKKKIMMQHDN